MKTTSMPTISPPRAWRVGGLRIMGQSLPILFADRANRYRMSVGRTRQRSIRIEHPSVSKRHAVIKRIRGGTFRIEDAGSKSGVWVSPVGHYSAYQQVESATLRLGMFIKLGKITLVTTDEIGRSPLMVARYSEFIRESERVYGSATEAEKFIGRSRKTIERLIRGVGRRLRRGEKK